MTAPSLGKSLPSDERMIFLSIFLFIFIVRYALDPFFYDLNPIDGSRDFAFTQMLKDGKFLGVDCFFTYGPLAQYLGPVLEADQGMTAVKLGFESLTVFFLGWILLDLSALLEGGGRVGRILFYLLTPVLLGVDPLLRSCETSLYDILVILTYLAFYLDQDRFLNRRKYLYVLLFWAVTLPQMTLPAASRGVS